MQEPERRTADQASVRSLAVLFLAVLVIAMSYGVTLPLIPALLMQAVPADNAAALARHTGLLTGIYTVALFFLCPLWGWLGDRHDRRYLLVIGLVGNAVMLLPLGLATSLNELYALRLASGMVSAAVLPSALAYVALLSAPLQRARHFALMTVATTLGFLLGPGLGSRLAPMALRETDSTQFVSGLMWDSPLLLTAVLSVVIGLFALRLPASTMLVTAAVRGSPVIAPVDAPRLIGWSLFLTGIVVMAITASEVGLTLMMTRQLPALAKHDVGYFFLICSVTMLGVQGLWLTGLHRYYRAWWLLAISLLLLSAGVALQPLATSPWWLTLFVAAAGAGTSVLLPALATLIADAAGARQGEMMGRQASAANFGQALAAGLTGYGFAIEMSLPFLAAGALVLTGLIVLRKALS